MNKMFKAALIASAIAIPVLFFWNDLQTVFGNKVPVATASINGGKNKKEKDKKEKKGSDNLATSNDVRITQQWEMPEVLTEISGIAYLNNTQIACVQDELGEIFIYNTDSKKVEKRIAFGAPGDYEGIAIAGNTAYVLRADGKIFEVPNFLNNDKPTAQQYSTPLTAKQDVEGLCYDKKNNRLLLAIKGAEPNSNDYKGIYAFDLSTKKMTTTPVYKIDLTHSIWGEAKGKKGKNNIQPSDLEVHPTTGDIYVIEGTNPKLLIMDASGNKKQLHLLSKSAFEQPEGIAFSPSGELFISSEGGNGAGTIAKVMIATGQ